MSDASTPGKLSYEIIQLGARVFQPQVERPDLVRVRELPALTFNLKESPFGLILEQTDPFTIPDKRYGDADADAEYFLKYFVTEKENVGVMLNGTKGSGKTMTANLMCVLGQSLGYPIINISECITGASLGEFLQKLNGQMCILRIDEFEKMYDDEAQAALLSVMEGSYSTTILWLLTANGGYKVSTFMQNRPGRLRYWKDYSGLSPEFVGEYCKDNLANRSWTRELQSIRAIMRDEFNFDILQAMVRESNFRNLPPTEVITKMNVKMIKGYPSKYRPTLFFKGSAINSQFILSKEISVDPIGLHNSFTVSVCIPSTDYEVVLNSVQSIPTMGDWYAGEYLDDAFICAVTEGKPLPRALGSDDMDRWSGSPDKAKYTSETGKRLFKKSRFICGYVRTATKNLISSDAAGSKFKYALADEWKEGDPYILLELIPEVVHSFASVAGKFGDSL